MATWVASSFNQSYFQIASISQAFVAQDLNNADTQWYIWGVITGANVKLKGPYVDQATAQTVLNNAIATLGGSI